MTKNNFSEKLKELRLKNKYTQKFVAEFLGLTQRQYQYCEQGHIPSQFDVVIKMCRLYDIDANELFGIGKINIYPRLVDIKNSKDNDWHIDKETMHELEKFVFGNVTNEIFVESAYKMGKQNSPSHLAIPVMTIGLAKGLGLLDENIKDLEDKDDNK